MVTLRADFAALRHPVVVLAARVLASVVAVVALLWVGIVGVGLVVFYVMGVVVAEDPAFYLAVALVIATATLVFATFVVLGVYAIWHTDEVASDVRRLAASPRWHRHGQ